jgi:hypothetical protein
MIKILNNRLLLLICFVLSLGFITSCDKNDDDANSGKVELLSFGPTGANHGDTLRFFGNNLDQVTAIEFTGASVTKKDFKTQTGKEILVIVPAAAERGYVTLKTPAGDIVSKTRLNLGVTATIASITDRARPGENITINGDFLNWVERITFADGKLVSTFVSKAKDKIVVTVPMDAQTGPLMIFYGGTDSAEVETDEIVTVTLPQATGISPNPAKHGTNLTITGTDLDLVKKVTLPGNTKAITSFVSQTATQLVVVVDSGTVKGKIKLMAPSGVETQSTQDVDVVMPAITKVNPSPVDPGADLTITGTNLDLVNSISFQNAPAVKTFVSQTPTQIVVKVPTGVTNGRLTFGILNARLTVQSPEILEINGAAPPPTIALPFYNDAVINWGGWTGGGWDGTADYNNTAPVREGSKSVKLTYTKGYGSPFQLGYNNDPDGNPVGVVLAPYTKFKISVYGAPGSNGKTITVAFNKANGKYNINVIEGKWTDYEIPISTLTSDDRVREIWVQDYSGSGGYSIYVDAIGLN